MADTSQMTFVPEIYTPYYVACHTFINAILNDEEFKDDLIKHFRDWAENA